MIPLPPAQRRPGLVHRPEGPAATDSIALAWRITGALDRAALATALQDVVAHHDALRTVFGAGGPGVPPRRVLPMEDLWFDVPMREVAPQDVSAGVRDAGSHPFDAECEIPFRACLLSCASDEHALVLVLHRLVAAGELVTSLVRDLRSAYAARRKGLAPEWAEPGVRHAYGRAPLAARPDAVRFTLDSWPPWTTWQGAGTRRQPWCCRRRSRC